MKGIRIFLSVLLLLLSGQVFAAGVTINTSDVAYRNVLDVPGTNINTEFEIRTQAMSRLVSVYRGIHGSESLPIGTIITFKWQDGSSEKGGVMAQAGSVLAEPIPGTQSKPPGGGVGYTNDAYGNFYGGSNVTGFQVITQTVTVCVGGYCESTTVVTGYEWLYGSTDPHEYEGVS